MSSEQDSPHNIDAIRNLLQKIEKAAEENTGREPEQPQAPVRELSSLRPSPAVLLQPVNRGQIAAPQIQLEPEELEGEFEEPRRSNALLTALLAGAVVACLGAGAFVYQKELATAARTSFPDLFQDTAPAATAAKREPIRPAADTAARATPGIAAATQDGGGPQSLPAGVERQPSSAANTGSAAGKQQAAMTMALDATITTQAGDSIPFPLQLKPLPSEADALLLIVRGVPEEMALSQGSAIGNEIWLMPAHRAASLTLTTADNLDGVFPLTVDLVAVGGRMIAQGRTELTVKNNLGNGQRPAPASEDEGAKRLVTRGEKMLETGDIAGARMLFERAAEAGSATAAFRMGETYDPVMLVTLGVQGISQGDEDAARRWYERARAQGHAGAADRLKDMRR